MKNLTMMNVSKIRKYLVFATIVLIFYLCMQALEFDILEFFLSFPRFMSFLVFEFFPPNFSVVLKYVDPILDTVFAAIIATIISTGVAVVLAFIVAKKTTPHQALSLAVKSFLSLFRNVPMLVWASLLTIIFGIGITAGVVALVIFSIAFLTRVLADAIDDVDIGVFEAMNSVGATRMQVIKQGIIPTFMPSFYAWILFMLEINIKASAILGLVGAGGLGYELKKNLDLFQYREACAIVFILIVMMLVIEYISTQVRSRLI